MWKLNFYVQKLARSFRTHWIWAILKQICFLHFFTLSPRYPTVFYFKSHHVPTDAQKYVINQIILKFLLKITENQILIKLFEVLLWKNIAFDNYTRPRVSCLFQDGINGAIGLRVVWAVPLGFNSAPVPVNLRIVRDLMWNRDTAIYSGMFDDKRIIVCFVFVFMERADSYA